MKKMTMTADQKTAFLEYTKSRIQRSTLKEYPHLTVAIQERTFDYMVAHGLTTCENGSAFIRDRGSKEMLSYGYSGYSMGTKDDEEGMVYNQYHETFCRAEWIARSVPEGYEDVVKAHMGPKAYQTIIGSPAA